MRGYGESNMLRCPFCDNPIDDPRDIVSRFGNTICGGRCGCGAVYVYDRTGHNMGDAYVDVLNLAYDGDLDSAWSKTPDVDYEIRELSFNARRNKFGRDAGSRGRPQPSFLFVRIKK